MNFILLTQNTTPIFRYIVWILGKLMEGIFMVIDAVGIPNIGLAIILFTIIINLLMMPLTIKQQKFAKLSSRMSPELQAIQTKYKDKTDQNSRIAMNNEMQAVYAKYGVSPTGSCGYLLIQMPILFALYRVIYAMPAYVKKIGDTFRVLATAIISSDHAEWLMNPDFSEFANAEQLAKSSDIAKTISMYGNNITESNMENGVIDVLNRLSSSDMSLVAQHYGLTDLTFNGQLILSNESTRGLIDTYNNFLGLNIGDSPQTLIVQAFHNGAWTVLIGALMIPILSAVTQWITVKLMPQQNSNSKNMDDTTAQMQSTMKSMNTVMPLLSAWFCLSLPAGMGIYWVAGSIVRGIQQVVINKHIDKMDVNEIIEKNKEKSAKKIEKMKENQEKINAYANMSTKNINQKANLSSDQSSNVPSQPKVAKAGSMMAKANMVSDYNKKSGKK
ncbi:MAG: YidC/Oxa1 family membrane protein insertase [Lachnospiraceae bacterium]|nr:YidC/Oxa1 family membrane protein insertase [Lachnospiraceae bacterium]